MDKSQSRQLLGAALVGAAALLAACGGPASRPADEASVTASGCPVCPTCPACTAGGATPTAQATARTLQPAHWGDLPGWQEDELAAAWPAFLHSCRALAARAQWPQWKAVCEQAKSLSNPSTTAIRQFLETRLQPWRLHNPEGTTSGLVTGYYEPLLRGSRTRGKPYLQPVLAVPADLLTIDLSSIVPETKHLRLRGRLQGNKVVPYFSRSEIVGRQNEHAERILLWVDDAIEFFFLQVQGSGRVRLTDGTTTRLAYADQNGHPYQSIGRLLVERGELSVEQATMQGIKNWARANPGRVDELLNANPSYVFFREQPLKASEAEGPQGALGVPLIAERSIAVDTRYVPLGAPVFLATTLPDSTTPLRRLVMAQDTGGAIRDAVRADYFWGFGGQAGQHAGRMKQQGQMWVLLPPAAAPK